MIPNCAATRHIHFELDGNGPAKFAKPDLDFGQILNFQWILLKE
jgi:hypothetical protein